MMEIFEEFIPNFMQVFLDDFALFNTLLQHIHNDMLLRHIVSKEGITIDPGKAQAIMDVKAPRNTKQLMRFRKHICWHSWVLHFLANLATPLHVAVHATPFSWTEV